MENTSKITWMITELKTPGHYGEEENKDFSLISQQREMRRDGRGRNDALITRRSQP